MTQWKEWSSSEFYCLSHEEKWKKMKSVSRERNLLLSFLVLAAFFFWCQTKVNDSFRFSSKAKAIFVCSSLLFEFSSPPRWDVQVFSEKDQLKAISSSVGKKRKTKISELNYQINDFQLVHVYLVENASAKEAKKVNTHLIIFSSTTRS